MSAADLEEHEAIRELALIFAERDARHGDHRSALAWLDTIEQIEGVLAPELEARRTSLAGGDPARLIERRLRRLALDEQVGLDRLDAFRLDEPSARSHP